MKHKSEKSLPRFDPRGAEAEDVFIEDLRGILWNSAHGLGLNWKQIAAEARLNVQTVSKFAYRETRRPTFYTIFRLMIAIGYRLEAHSGQVQRKVANDS